MLCKDLMKTELQYVAREDTAGAAARRMRDEEVGFLPVCDQAGGVIGTLTDRDIAIRLVAEDLSPETPVAEIMTAEIVACDPNDSIEEAQSLMGHAKVSRILCIADGSDRLVGVISLSDIAQLEQEGRAAQTLREVSAREARI